MVGGRFDGSMVQRFKVRGSKFRYIGFRMKVITGRSTESKSRREGLSMLSSVFISMLLKFYKIDVSFCQRVSFGALSSTKKNIVVY